jgi:RHS repeat-associated protein
VDVVTGRVFTSPVTDLYLTGPLPLSLVRSYSSEAHHRDVGIGPGWSHSLGWAIELRPRMVRVWDDGGVALDFPEVAVGGEVLGPGGWRLRREPWGYRVDAKDGCWRDFPVRDERARRHRLLAIEDRNKNRIALTYGDAGLVEVIDSAGRTVRFTATREGRIATVAVQDAGPQGRWVVFATYTYDEQGDLVRVEDADGHATHYTYEDHLLTSWRDATGLTFHFRYDRERRCIETWGDYPGGKDHSLAEDVPALLADGVTRAKGIFHVKLDFDPNGYSEVADSLQVKRYFGNEFGKLDKAVQAGGVYTRTFDERGNVRSLTDPLGATTSWELDARGRVLKSTDPIGRVTVIQRDENGLPVLVIDPGGGVTRLERDARGNVLAVIDPLGNVLSYRYDDRGSIVEATLPNGGRTLIRRDEHGDRTEVIEPNGGIQRVSRDAFGRITAWTDQRGATTRYDYSTRGDVLAIHHPNGGVTRMSYDGVGHLVGVVDADGRSHAFEWSGLDSLCKVRRPNGGVVSFRYNREGQLCTVVNERGERHDYIRNRAGYTVEERTFDGRRLKYKYDEAGQLVCIEDGQGDQQEFVYDLAGQLVERRFTDGDVESFAYDPRGQLIRAANRAADCTFEFDAVGRIVHETQRVDDEIHEVKSAYDPLGKRVRRTTSLRHDEIIERDVMGYRTRVQLGAAEVLMVRDAVGNEILRRLPAGGQIESEFDVEGQLARRRVTTPSPGPTVAAGQPDWVGPRPRHFSIDQAYRYSPAGELLDAWDQFRGLTRFEYDPMGQLLAHLPAGAPAELFRYDPAGNLFEAGTPEAPRMYGSGGPLLRKGSTEYLYDTDGRLTEKRVPSADGAEPAITRYRWNTKGLLTAVRAPDGSVIEFAYDSFSRRVSKVVSRPLVPQTAPVPVETTRFVWDEDLVAHEIRKVAVTAGDPVVEERTYCFEEGRYVPWAHWESRNGVGSWFHYVNDTIGTPTRLVDERGEVACEVQHSAWGSVAVPEGARATTAFGFQGQYHDRETGFAYSRNRYYDPDAGRFISPDPYGLGGGLNAFRYAYNRPTLMVDPEGLDAFTTITGRDNGQRTSADGSSGNRTPGDLHPAVRSCLADPPQRPLPPQNCGEPQALSNYLYNYEARHNIPPGTSSDAQVAQALGTIDRRGVTTTWRDDGRRNPPWNPGENMETCPNCGALFDKMRAKYGNRSDGVNGLRPGAVTPGLPPLRTRTEYGSNQSPIR